jgi:hypothetical protein
MFGEEAKGGLGGSGEQAPQKLTSDTKIGAPRETREEHEVEDSAPDALDSVGQLASEPIDLPESSIGRLRLANSRKREISWVRRMAGRRPS